jgi:hypothetical protein
MEHENREKYVRLAELKSVVSFLLSCEYPVSAYVVYQHTGVSAANLAWVIEKLRSQEIAFADDEAVIHLLADRRRLFSLGRLLRLSKIRHALDRIPDEMTIGSVGTEIDTIPHAWRLHRGEKD